MGHGDQRARGSAGGKELNIADEAIDSHDSEGPGEPVAPRRIAKDGSKQNTTYKELQLLTNSFENALKEFGVNRGDRVFSLLGRVPKLFIFAIGTTGAIKIMYC